MKSLLGASFNKSHGASCNTIKLILLNQFDIKRHFAFLYSLRFCQTFLLNTIFFPRACVVNCGRHFKLSQNTMYLNGTSLFDRKISKKIGCFEMLSRRL